MSFLWNLGNLAQLVYGIFLLTTEVFAQQHRGSLQAVTNPIYIVSGKNVQIPWNYNGDSPQKVILRVRIKNTTEMLDLWTINVSNDGNEQINKNEFLDQTNAKSLSGRTKADYLRNQYSLTIEKFTQLDTKFAFVCVVEYDQFNSITQQVDIFMAVPPVITSRFGGALEIPKGGIVDLECSSTGNPAPEIEWRKDNTIRSSAIANVNLIIGNIQPEDTGTYNCNAVNQAGSSEKTVAITVTYIEVDPTYLRVRPHAVGARAEASCPILGYPQPTYIWKKQDSIIGGQQTLIIDSITSDDFAMYSCIATNKVGTLQTTIELADKGWTDPDYGTRSNAQKTCSTFALVVVTYTTLSYLIWS